MVLTRFLDYVSRGAAFFPPTPPTYDLKSIAGKLSIHPKGRRVISLPSKYEVTELPVDGKYTILVAFFPSPAARTTSDHSQRHPTLLHSHGNATDLGQLIHFYEQLSHLLKCNIVAYDYRGYGARTDPQSLGRPSASGCLLDIKTVFNYLTAQKRIPPQDIILYGQSIGSGPSTWLGSTTNTTSNNNNNIAGLVLHSPFTSGFRVLAHDTMGCSKRAWPSLLDIFPNIHLIGKVNCRVLVMHGEDDEVIPVAQGKMLAQLARNCSEPLWAVGHGHDNLEFCEKYVDVLKRFLGECFGDCYLKLYMN
jgi:abhydrolase domain-containing protein 17